MEVENNILSDIIICVEKDRLDKKILSAIYVISQISDASQKELNLNDIYKELTEYALDNDFRLKLDIYYKTLEGEDGRLLLDPNVVHDQLYILDLELYSKILKIELEINQVMGKIKKFIIQDKSYNW